MLNYYWANLIEKIGLVMIILLGLVWAGHEARNKRAQERKQ